MARPAKYDYDSNDFYDEVFDLAMNGLTDTEIADSLDLSPEVFSCMKNGNYQAWSENENKSRSERLSKVLSRGRRRILGIVRGRYLKVALGGIKVKSVSTTTRKMRVAGELTDDEEIQTTETESELPPNLQALSTWLHHHDLEWRSREKEQEDDGNVSGGGSISIDKWISDNTEP